ncbi:hypothetical protein MSG28_004674 [Choristoneura fumiferana]|uniref:Uncharacterized protein n=1 Tax=Choristoneura fumiferana TaxID=7141 RepID=A0ACC0K759_CHOFU|nr:hypothetical protein MSG28_004674 [Choristoneura fumiferana]
MKEECKLCSVSGWVAPPPPTDFSISSLMRPGQARAQGVPAPRARAEPRHDAVLLSAYLLKLGDYPLNTLHERAVELTGIVTKNAEHFYAAQSRVQPSAASVARTAHEGTYAVLELTTADWFSLNGNSE